VCSKCLGQESPWSLAYAWSDAKGVIPDYRVPHAENAGSAEVANRSCKKDWRRIETKTRSGVTAAHQNE
jgi:hypothetical protein